MRDLVILINIAIALLFLLAIGIVIIHSIVTGNYIFVL